MEFLLTSLVVAVMPGSGVLFTIAAGLARGTRAGVIAAFGCTLGIIPHMIAAISGLEAVLHAGAPAFQALKYLGVAYLLFMAWSTFRDTSALVPEADSTPRSFRRVIASGVLMNILNPKLTLFFFAFLPQFVNTRAPSAYLRMAELSAYFMLITFLVFVGYAQCASAARRQVISLPGVVRWMRRVFAGAFAALGVRLAFF
ncbi:LysE family translocator [Streptomyces sp. NPDC093589]|uniref:LysE family translocator n=1 Tax=Streptomyces sp. NPDC093589 TaxID=3366043 RepID=UPI003808866C